MAEGDLVVLANQYEYNSALVGRSTAYIVSDIEGLLSMPQLRDNDVDRQDSPGTWANTAYPSARVVEYDVTALLNTPAAAEAAVEALSLAYQAEPGVFHRFVFSRPGLPNRYLWAQCRKREFTADYELTHGLLTGSVSLYCPDPRIYSMTTDSDDTSILPTFSTANMDVDNDGNYNAPLKITIEGPCTDPSITSTPYNRAIRTSIVLGALDVLEIDTRQRTVLLNGDDSYHSLRNDNQWFDLQPGTNNLVFTRVGTSGTSTFTVDKSDVWM